MNRYFVNDQMYENAKKMNQQMNRKGKLVPGLYYALKSIGSDKRTTGQNYGILKKYSEEYQRNSQMSAY